MFFFSAVSIRSRKKKKIIRYNNRNKSFIRKFDRNNLFPKRRLAIGLLYTVTSKQRWWKRERVKKLVWKKETGEKVGLLRGLTWFKNTKNSPRSGNRRRRVFPRENSLVRLHQRPVHPFATLLLPHFRFSPTFALFSEFEPPPRYLEHAFAPCDRLPSFPDPLWNLVRFEPRGEERVHGGI